VTHAHLDRRGYARKMSAFLSRRSPLAASLTAMAFVISLTISPAARADAQAADAAAMETSPAPGERALVGRLVAPCCYQQTLDVHTGPAADALRAEVRRRLWAGESSEAIEEDLVSRYGPKVLAVPPGNPIAAVATSLAALTLVAGAGLLVVVRRWRKAGQRAAPTPATTESTRDAYDERLDDELRAMS